MIKVQRLAWFKELNKDSIPLVGGKGANLGEMYNISLPIPPGFVITSLAYKEFIEINNIKDKIYSILKDLDVNDNTKLQKASKEIQTLILKTPMLEDLESEILESYDALDIPENKKTNNIINSQDYAFVAVRSSATAEDMPTASFAGQMASYLNIQGPKRLLAAIKACWASLFTARAIFYRIKNNFPHEKVLIAVIIQKMVDSEVAGIMFSVNPVNENPKEILIEASYGLGESVVSGSITPDEFVIDKDTLEQKTKKVAKKEWGLFRSKETHDSVKVPIALEKQEIPSLSNFETKKLADFATKIEQHYNKPQDMEFALEKGKIYITQSRPITTLGKKKEIKKKREETQIETPKGDIELKDANLIVSGIPASPGIGKGKVVLVHSLEELGKVKQGDVLVARQTNPDYVAAMERAAAIVTDTGGSTAHAAIVSREMGIPCIVGTEVATSKLKEGQEITIDGTKGKVYEGYINIEEKKEKIDLTLKTKIKIKVIMDLPNYAERAAATGADGVGLLRGEFINLNKREHPVYMIQSGKKDIFVAHLVENIKTVCKAFKDKPVWYRTLDAPTDEFRHLPGGENEPKEDNPMLGWRSIRRSLDQPELLKAEYEAIKQVHEAGYTKLGIMIPLVTHVKQVSEAKRIFKETTGLEPCKDIDFGIMIETPASVMIIEELCKEGISFASIGSNDLTQFTLACDRNSAKVAKLYDEMHPAVTRLIKRVLRTCHHYGVKTSICGQAGSKPEMAKFLFREKIDSIASNPDAVNTIRKIIHKLEQENSN